MSSIIDYFKTNNLKYTLTSSTPVSGYPPEHAFDKNNNRFDSLVPSPFWQINFEKIVTIESYIIGALTNWNWWVSEWKISYSLDGNSLIDLQTDSLDDLRGNTKKFPLKKLISCKSFRIS